MFSGNKTITHSYSRNPIYYWTNYRFSQQIQQFKTTHFYLVNNLFWFHNHRPTYHMHSFLKHLQIKIFNQVNFYLQLECPKTIFQFFHIMSTILDFKICNVKFCLRFPSKWSFVLVWKVRELWSRDAMT